MNRDFSVSSNRFWDFRTGAGSFESDPVYHDDHWDRERLPGDKGGTSGDRADQAGEMKNSALRLVN